MILKILFTVIAVIAALFVLRVVGGSSTASVARDKTKRAIAKRQRESAPMVRCARCSAWHDPAEKCACSSSSS